MTHYDRYTLISHEVNGEIHRKWFHDEAPIYSYHLPQDVRRYLVAEVFQSGCKSAEVAELLGISESMVSTDLKYMRIKFPNLVDPQVKPVDVTPADEILKSTLALKPQNYTPTPHGWLNN